jgi:hypothetical protein
MAAMKSWLPLVLGLIAILSGTVWTLQGLGHIGGSAMSGERIWAVIGPVVALVGVGLVVVAIRSLRRPRPPST